MQVRVSIRINDFVNTPDGGLFTLILRHKGSMNLRTLALLFVASLTLTFVFARTLVMEPGRQQAR